MDQAAAVPSAPALSTVARTGSSVLPPGPRQGLQLPFLALPPQWQSTAMFWARSPSVISLKDPEGSDLLCPAFCKLTGCTQVGVRPQHPPSPGVCTPSYHSAGQRALQIFPLHDVPPSLSNLDSEVVR